MMAYENDVFVIPEELRKMTVSELEREKKRLLAEIKKQEVPKKRNKTSNTGIIYNF